MRVSYVDAGGTSETLTSAALNVEAQLVGTPGNDTLTGDGAANSLAGNAGDDNLAGQAGADTLDGGAGYDFVGYNRESGGGPILVNFTTGFATDSFGATDTLLNVEGITGTSGGDTVFGSNGLEHALVGLGGNDSFAGGNAFNYFDGGEGSDTFVGAPGQQNLASYEDAEAALAIDLSTAVAGVLTVADPVGGGVDTLINVNRVRGTQFGDSIGGDANRNVFQGLGGNDTITGGGGIDRVDYTADDQNGGSSGIIVNFSASNINVALPGADPVTVLASHVRDGFGAQDLVTQVQQAVGTRFADYFLGGAGNESFVGGAGNDTIDGGGGVNAVMFFTSNTGVHVDLGTPANNTGDAQGDSYANIQNILGTIFADTLTGDGAGNNFFADAGNDSLNGALGDDFLYGGAGGDTLVGGDGNDTLGGEAGNDFLSGGLGVDAVEYGLDPATTGTLQQAAGPNGSILIQLLVGVTVTTLFTLTPLAGGGLTVLSNVDGSTDTIDGSVEFADFFISNPAGPPPSSTRVTLGGGGSGLLGTLGPDTLTGTAGGDSMSGLAGADSLFGGTGDDTLVGGLGADTLNGGAGVDRVDYGRDSEPGGVFVDLTAGTAIDGFGFSDVLVSIEEARGTDFNDTLIGWAGTTGANLIGRGGNDSITGLANFNFLQPGSGNDTVIGGSGTGDELSYQDHTTPGQGVAIDLTAIGAGGFVTVSDPFGGIDSVQGIERLRGTINNDTFIGDGLNNRFRGLAGNDSFDGGAGFDRISYRSDEINNGLSGVIVNLNATQSVAGVGPRQARDGFGNTDTFVNIESAEGTIYSDTMMGSDPGGGSDGTNQFIGLGGGDSFNGAGGFDWVGYYDAPAGVLADLGNSPVQANPLDILASAFANTGMAAGDTYLSIEELDGSPFADTLYGDNAADNFLWGDGGDDLLVGRGGYDGFWGGAGADTFDGTPTAADAFEILDQDYDRVQLQNTSDATPAFGVVMNLSDAAITVNLAGTPLGPGTLVLQGQQSIDLSGVNGQDVYIDIELLSGTTAADTLIGGHVANNRYEAFFGLGGADSIDGGSGYDEVRYDRDQAYGGTQGVQVNLASGSAVDGFGSVDALVGIEGVKGTSFSDTAIGGNENGSFNLLAGNDSIDGGAGFDALFYRFDNGTQGVIANLSALNLTFEIGTSTVTQTAGTVRDNYGGTDSVAGIEAIDGSAFADYIMGSAAANSLMGRGGDDFLDGGAGADTLNGNGGTNQIDYSLEAQLGGTRGVIVNLSSVNVTGNASVSGFVAGDPIPVVAGGSARDAFNDTDQLFNFQNIGGTAGNDILVGSGAANQIHSNGGSDTMDGNGGNDVFVFDGLTGNSVVTDFSSVSGNDDVVQLVGITSVAEFQSLATLTTVAGGVLIDFTSIGHTITLQGATQANLQFTVDPTGTSLLIS